MKALASAASLGLLLVTASSCGDSSDLTPVAPRAVTASVADEVPTLVSVSWSTDVPSIGYVEYGNGELTTLTTPFTPEATSHSLELRGLLPDTHYDFRVVTWGGGDAGRSPPHSFETGEFSVTLPRFESEGDERAGFIILPLPELNLVSILNPQGQVVWAHSDDGGLPVYRARLSADGDSILYNRAGPLLAPVAESAIVRVSFDGSELAEVTIPMLGADFVEHPDGTLAALVSETRETNGVLAQGDKIVEISRDGSMTDVWSTWDSFEAPTTEQDGGWSFANALDYNDSEQAYYVGLSNLSSIAKVDRAQGTCEWVLGANAQNFGFSADSEPFLHQSQFHVAGNRLLVSDGADLQVARVIEYQLDFTDQIAAQVGSFSSDTDSMASTLGEPTRFPGGETLVNWGSQGRLERFDKDGNPVWQLSAADTAFGYHTLAATLTPSD